MNVLIALREEKDFTSNEKAVKDYILRHKNDIFAMSIQSLSAATYVSPATIVRLSKKIGCSGFADFKQKFIQDVKTFEFYNINVLDDSAITQNDSLQEIIDKITKITLSSIEETKMMIDEQSIKKAAKMIHEAKIIDIYGIESSGIVANDAVSKLMRIGKVAFHFDSQGRQLIQAKNSDKDHIGIIISYTGETKVMIEIAEELLKNNVEIITITSNTRNSLVQLSDNNLYVSSRETVMRSGAVASRASSMYLIDLIQNICILMDYDKATKNIEKTRVIEKNQKM
jgi:DNA-binding MurR/RpiR family transcriptional regulator